MSLPPANMLLIFTARSRKRNRPLICLGGYYSVQVHTVLTHTRRDDTASRGTARRATAWNGAWHHGPTRSITEHVW